MARHGAREGRRGSGSISSSFLSPRAAGEQGAIAARHECMSLFDQALGAAPLGGCLPRDAAADCETGVNNLTCDLMAGRLIRTTSCIEDREQEIEPPCLEAGRHDGLAIVQRAVPSRLAEIERCIPAQSGERVARDQRRKRPVGLVAPKPDTAKHRALAQNQMPPVSRDTVGAQNVPSEQVRQRYARKPVWRCLEDDDKGT